MVASFSLSPSTVCSFPQVTAQTQEVICCRIQQRNMATTVEKLQLCIPGIAAACVSLNNTIIYTACPLRLAGGWDQTPADIRRESEYTLSTPSQGLRIETTNISISHRIDSPMTVTGCMCTKVTLHIPIDRHTDWRVKDKWLIVWTVTTIVWPREQCECEWSFFSVYWVCAALATCPWCTLPLAQSQLGSAPALPPPIRV